MINDCCKAERSTTASLARTGPLAAIGALLSAVASSACCWLPLLLLAFGASATGLSAWFERYRSPFLIVAGLMLAFSFYAVYFRVRQCEPGSACATTNPASRRVTKSMLWLSTVFVVAFAAFPKYIGVLLPDAQPAAGVAASSQTVVYEVEGMTCEACAVTLQKTLREVDGVIDATVSYADHTATVLYEHRDSDAPGLVTETMTARGYSVARATTRPNSKQEP